MRNKKKKRETKADLKSLTNVNIWSDDSGINFNLNKTKIYLNSCMMICKLGVYSASVMRC